MASVKVNINTASLSQLKSIKGIGDVKARQIIQAREEKGGGLTLDDLYGLHDFTKTFWDNLIRDQAIIVDSNHDEQDQGALVNDLKSRISGLEQERLQYTKDFQSQMDSFKQRSQAEIEDLQDKFDKQMLAFEAHRKDLEEEVKKCKTITSQQQLEIAEAKSHNEKLQKQLVQRDSLSKIEKVISDRTNKGQTLDNKEVNSTCTFSSSNAPKLPVFDGKVDWRAYILQFSIIADRCNWSKDQRLFRLVECLRDKPLKFFSSRPVTVRSDFDSLCKKLNEKFGKKEMPHVLRRILQEIRQEPEETLEDFAERTQEIAFDGFPDTPERLVETLTVDAFLKGCADKRAALVAIDKNPESLDEAVHFVKAAIANQRVIMGGRRTDIKRVSFECNENTEEADGIAVRLVEKDSGKPGVSLINLDSRLKQTEDDVAEMKIMVKKILGVLSNNQNSRSRQQSPGSERQHSPIRRSQDTCFECGVEGHFARNCPNRRPRSQSPQRNLSRSPSPSFQRGLNFRGSRTMASS